MHGSQRAAEERICERPMGDRRDERNPGEDGPDAQPGGGRSVGAEILLLSLEDDSVGVLP